MTMPQLSRRFLLLGGAAIAGSATLASCSTAKTTNSSTGGSGNAGSGTVTAVNLNVWGAKPTFVKNFNPVSPAEGVVGTAYLYDQLLWVDRVAANELKPWLAKEWKFDRTTGTMDLTLRDDATWSDGKKITADDVVYTVVGMTAQAAKQGAQAETFAFSAEKTGEFSVKFTWPKDKIDIEGDRKVALLKPKPKHIYEAADLGKFTNAEAPVTSTPLTLERYTPQQVTFKVRDDHWMGKFDHVKEVNWVTYGSEEIGRNLLAQGKMDWATLSLQNPDQYSKTPGNHYWTVYANNAESIIFNCAKAPFNDAAVRNAIYAALDTDKMHSLFDIGLPSISPTGLDPNVWGDWVKPELKEPHKADVEKAKKYLADAGWTVEGGNLTKDGKSYPISYKTVADYTNWATWSDGVRDQMKSALGIDLKVLKVTDAQIWDQINQGDYEMSMNWAAAGTHVVLAYSSLDGADYMPLGEDAVVNYQRVKDAKLDELIKKGKAETDEAKLKEIGYEIQQYVVDQCFFAPLNPGVNFCESTEKNWKGWPGELTAGVVPPLAYGTADTWQILQKLTPTH